MAAIPQSFEQRPRKGKAPVSAHPAFPVVVAIWFAALLGLGSLVLPAALIERLVTATGLAELLPFAAPPLGMKARALIALAAALIGATLGWLAARKVAAGAEPLAAGRNPRGAGRRPLNAHAELGPDGFDGDAPRRRALTIAEEERPSEWLQVAPLPGQPRHESADLAEIADDPELAQWEAEAPLELELDLAEALPDEVVPEAEETVFELPELPPVPAERQEFRPFAQPSFAAASEEEQAPMRDEPRQQFRPFADPVPETAPVGLTPMPAAAVAAPPVQIFAPVPAAAETDTQELAEMPEMPGWASAPIEDLGLMQLVQRLGATLEKHREWAASQRAQALAGAAVAASLVPAAEPASASATPAPVFDAGLGVADPEEAAQAMAAFFAAPAGAAPAPSSSDAPTADDDAGMPFPSQAERQLFRPQAEERPQALPEMRSFPGVEALEGSDLADFDSAGHSADEEEDDAELGRLAASFSLPLRRNDVEAPAANPFRAAREEFVRIEEPENPFDEVRPAVIFPHDAARAVGAPAAARPFDPPPAAIARPAISGEDSAQALREALMNLQRVSTGN